MSTSPIEYKTIAELQAGLNNKTITSVEIVSKYLEKIKTLDSLVGAFVQVYADEALAAAKKCDDERSEGKILSALHGLPIAVKDLVDISGKVTTAGSPLFTNVANESADLIHLLKQAGLIIIGKTKTVQFALGAWGNNEHMGTPKNPWSVEKHLTPGGSSSGSAVAVACGMVPLSIGTDTGGSIRVPASFCSITGLKTSIHRISTKGVTPLSTSLDTVGLFAKDAAPLRDLLEILSPSKHQNTREIGKNSVSINQLKLGRLDASELRGASPDVINAYEEFIAVLAQQGAVIETIQMPFSFETVAKVSSTIMLAEAATEYADIARDLTKLVDSSVRPRLLAGAELSATAYIQALRDQSAMKIQFSEVTSHLDAILTPASMCTAIPIDEVNHDRPPVRYTRLINLLDMCGVSIPCGFDQQGLPIGIQIAGAQDSDETILQISERIQDLSNHHKAYPESMSFF